MELRVGVDVGSTNTDCAVLSAGGAVVGCAKVPTTEDVLSGVAAALQDALQDAKAEPGSVGLVALGTTAFVNACVQLRGLAKVAVLRLCGPATRALPPFCDMPPALRAAVAGYSALVEGGLEYDGKTEIAPLDEAELRACMRRALAAGVEAVVVSGIFSPVQPAQEDAAVAVLADEAAATAPAARVFVSASHRIGQLGLLERENAAVLNAALQPLARRVVPACQRAAWGAGITAPLMLTSNDGTLISAEAAAQTPVLTFQSGPVNSLRGALALSGLQDALVVDIGGTTSDVGVLCHGLPRPAPRAVQVAGAPTNFQMPDVWSVGLGGGSLLHFSRDDGACSVGPLSVGARLMQEAACAGGDALTATDAAVVLGRMRLGDAQRAQERLTAQQAQRAWEEMQRVLAEAVDRMKPQAGDMPVVVVGGGAPLCGDVLPGASTVVRPRHSEVANAVGAAIPQVGGTLDVVVDLGPSGESRAQRLEQLECQAVRRAVAAGARADACSIAALEVLPLAYLPGNNARVMVKAVGQLDVAKLRAQALAEGPAPAAAPLAAAAGAPAAPVPAAVARSAAPGGGAAEAPAAVEFPGRGDDVPAAELAAWQPEVGADGCWVLREPDLHLVAIGAGILGCGGGGSPGHAKLKALMLLRSGGRGRLQVVHPASLPPSGLVIDASFMGAPTVGIEKLDSDQAQLAAEAALQQYRSGSGDQAPLVGVVCGEVGGGNGIEPLVVAASLGLPVVDGDLMGRAFPELHMMTSAIYGQPVAPAALADEKGNSVVVRSVRSAAWLERLLRPLCTEMGCSAGFASCPLRVSELRRVLVPHTLSLAWRLGKAVVAAQHAKHDAPAAAAAVGGGRVMFTGKIVEVERKTQAGFARGRLQLRALQGPGSCEIQFQNENLVAYVDGSLVATVPDLICCLEAENGLPIATEEARYGLRAAVLVLPAHPLLRTPRALPVVGPAAFGHREVDYTPVAKHAEPEPIPRHVA